MYRSPDTVQRGADTILSRVRRVTMFDIIHELDTKLVVRVYCNYVLSKSSLTYFDIINK